MDYLRQIINSPSSVIFFSLDREYRYLVFNDNHRDTMNKIWGVSIQEGNSMLDYIHNDADQLKAKENFDKVLAGEEFTLIEEYGDEHLQRSFWEDTYSPLKNEDGEIIGLTVYVSDITERRNSELKIQEREELLNSVTSNIQEGIYRSSVDNGIVYVNESFVRIFGYKDSSEVLKTRGSAFFHNPEERKVLMEKLKKFRFIKNEQVLCKKKNGESLWVLMSARILADSNGGEFIDGAIRDISEQKKLEDEIIANKRLVDSINQNISEGIYRSDEKGLIYVNQAFAHLFGYGSPDDMLQLKAIQLYDNPDQRDRLVKVLETTGSFTNEEVSFIRKDGSKFIGLISSTSFESPDGKLFWDGAIRDITIEKNSQAEIRKNEQLLNSINQNINEAIYRSTDDSGLIYVNQGFADMFGFSSPEEVMAHSALDLYEDQNVRNELGKLLKEKGFCANHEVVFKRKDGTLFRGSLSSSKTFGEAGEIYFDGAIRDISAEKYAEEAMMKQLEVIEIINGITMKYLNMRLEELPNEIEKSLHLIGRFCHADRVYVFDIDHVNNTCSNTYEWVQDGVTPEIENCQNLPLDMMDEAMTYNEGRPLIIEDTRKVKSNEYREFLFDQGIKSLLSVPSMVEGKFVGFVGLDFVNEYHSPSPTEKMILSLFAEILASIRNRTQRQIERKQLLETATHQNDRLKEFSYITSHNIRSSVANILGLLTLQESNPTNPKINQMLKVTANKLNDTLANINELLNFEHEFEEMTKMECDLNQVINDVIGINYQQIVEKSVTIKNLIPEKFMVMGFPAYLESIFHNLVLNSIKYGTNDRNSTIEVSCTKDGPGQWIHVRDFGEGIDLEQYREKLFKLGSRFHSDKSDGQGLGLFMTKRQIEAMGGKIEVESEMGKGTTFRVWLHG